MSIAGESKKRRKEGRKAVGKVAVFLESIKVTHSIFALPFALAAAFIAAGAMPPAGLVGKIVLACIFARTAAMSFNRFADAEIDRRNPRTAARAVPAGELSKGFMGGATILSSVGFVATAGWINELAFRLSPVALAVLLGYSYTKRLTYLSHLFLGAALGLSPLGAWVAVRDGLALPPVLLGLAVLFWTAGFDVIYACQDHEFDRRAGLFSLPRRLGIARALLAARFFHAAAVALLAVLGLLEGFGAVYAGGVAAVAGLLVYEHSLVSPQDLSRVNVAFFTLNGLVSLFFMAAVILEVVL